MLLVFGIEREMEEMIHVGWLGLGQALTKLDLLL